MGRICGEMVELFWCVVRQFNVRSVVHEEEFKLMRASFYFTHHIDSGACSVFTPCHWGINVHYLTNHGDYVWNLNLLRVLLLHVLL